MASAETAADHVPVLLSESLHLLSVVAGGCYCDATVGAGGHANEILKRSAPDGKLLGIDRDPDALEYCRRALSRYGDRVTLYLGTFADLAQIVRDASWPLLDGVLADFGLSSRQLDDPDRGFTFQAEGPLDMRMSPMHGRTAGQLVAQLSEDDLGAVLRDYGDERYHRRIARAIKRAHRDGRLKTTTDLRDTVVRCVHPKGRWRIHPATRTFQALRIAVNDELDAIDDLLNSVFDLLKPGGRVAAISFHSLEDRRVKQRLAALSQPRLPDVPGLPGQISVVPPVAKVLTRKPVRPSDTESDRNPRARSARLRAAEKLP